MGTLRVRNEVGDLARERFEPVDALVHLPPETAASGSGRIDGRQEFSLVLFGGQALLGAVTLDELRLAPDPASRRLVPVPALLMRLAA